MHPDVRRMLMDAKAFTEGMRALCLWGALQVDLSHKAATEEEREQADMLIGLLTPVIKGYGTDKGYEVATNMQQVFGGHGYIEEWGMSQFVRDARIAQIYEGTNGVQAMDLCGRKLAQKGGAAMQAFFKVVGDDIAEAKGDETLAPMAEALEKALGQQQAATMWFMQNAYAEPQRCASRRRRASLHAHHGHRDAGLDVAAHGPHRSIAQARYGRRDQHAAGLRWSTRNGARRSRRPVRSGVQAMDLQEAARYSSRWWAMTLIGRRDLPLAEAEKRAATMWFMQNAMQNPNHLGAGAHHYMHIMGIDMWLRMAKVAQAAGQKTTRRSTPNQPRAITWIAIFPTARKLEKGSDSMMAGRRRKAVRNSSGKGSGGNVRAFCVRRELRRTGQHGGPALALGTCVMRRIRAAIGSMRHGETVFDPGIAVEMPFGLHSVHFFPKTDDLLSGDHRIGITVACRNARRDRLRGGQRGFEQAVKTGDGEQVLSRGPFPAPPFPRGRSRSPCGMPGCRLRSRSSVAVPPPHGVRFGS